MSGPDPDKLSYSQATKWFGRETILTNTGARAVSVADMVLEGCGVMVEIRITCISGVVQVSNRSGGTYITIPVGSTIFITAAKAEIQAWVKHDGTSGLAQIHAFGFEK